MVTWVVSVPALCLQALEAHYDNKADKNLQGTSIKGMAMLTLKLLPP